MAFRGAASVPGGGHLSSAGAGVEDEGSFGFDIPPFKTAQDPGQGHLQQTHGHLHSRSQVQEPHLSLPQLSGGSGLQSQQANSTDQLEDHIARRPFAFSAFPSARPPGLAPVALDIKTSSGSTSSSPSESKASMGSTVPHTEQAADPISLNNETYAMNPAGSGLTVVGMSANGNRGRQAGGASDFVKKLYKMLEEDQYRSIVTWAPKGDSFIVKVGVLHPFWSVYVKLNIPRFTHLGKQDMNEFTKTVLPHHFKHSNFASFVRQLNKYDFHKVKNPETNLDASGESVSEPAFHGTKFAGR